MSKGIETQTGPYMHAADARITKSFPGGREFVVLVAGAYNAGGLVGPEHNGLVILDVNNRNVILDRHMEISSGYFGPSPEQYAELKRVADMDWPAFTNFIRTNPRYRACMDDIYAAAPAKIEPIANRVIAEAVTEGPYPRALTGRKEIIEFLLGHKMHRVDTPYSPYALAWNIKVGSFDSSGHHPDFEADPAFDAQWQAYIESNDELFWDIAGEATAFYTQEGLYSLYEDGEPLDADFSTTGRSGGWMILTKLEGTDLTWDSQSEMEAALLKLDDTTLARLYTVVAQLDVDLAHPEKEMEYRYASLRQVREEEWKLEAEEAPSI